MHVITLADAREGLAELVHDLAGSGEFLITEHNHPVARLSAVSSISGSSALLNLKPVNLGAILKPFPDASL